MKRFVLTCLLSLMLLTLAACGKAETENPETTTKSEETKQEATSEETNWYFMKDDVKIEIDAPAQPILDALGEYQSSYEAPSCAFDGMDVVYTYPGFEILTYEVDGEAKISGVVLRDDTVETVEGICIGSSKADAEAAYGKLEEGATSLQVTKGNCELLVILTDDVVSSIQYLVAD